MRAFYTRLAEVRIGQDPDAMARFHTIRKGKAKAPAPPVSKPAPRSPVRVQTLTTW